MIGILDSGVGGLSIYKALKDRLPGVKVVYLADKKNFPYGEKTEAELVAITKDAVSTLIENGASVVVIACNSATVSTIDILRSNFAIPIIGVEPAIKQAAGVTRTGNIGVIATSMTIDSHDGAALAAGKTLIKSHNGELVEKIENGFEDITDSDIVVAMAPFKDKNVDSVVLGCTHYHFVKGRLEKLFPEISFYTPEEAVTSRLLAVMNEENIGLEAGDDIFLVTANEEGFRKSLYNLLEIKDADVRKV